MTWNRSFGLLVGPKLVKLMAVIPRRFLSFVAPRRSFFVNLWINLKSPQNPLLFFHLSMVQVLILTLIPVIILAVLIVRHAKAAYLAMDHYFFHE